MQTAYTYDPRGYLVRSDGTRAGRSTVSGYREVKVAGRWVREHRAIWEMFNGPLGNALLDHINGDRADNRLENLRVATAAQNQHNRKVQKNSKSGVKNVDWMPGRKKWRAKVHRGGKDVTLGYFDSMEDAAAAASEFRKANDGKFYK